jgi:hypothetical protein
MKPNEPYLPISNYDGVGSNKVIDYFGKVFELDRLTNKYVEVKDEAKGQAGPRRRSKCVI